VRAFLIFVTAASFCAAADLPAVHVRNFDKVNDHLYRGGEPTAVGVQELGAMGVKTIIDLRQAGEGTGVEKELAEKLKLKYINIPLGEFSAPSKAQIEQILTLLQDNADSTLFVHCRRGKDRTGTVIACYRIQHDGWDNQRALAEAKEHGMSSFERAMRSFILHFTPLTLPGLGQPATLTPAVAK
jgi:tyrosine-protein phosphatase SIW14